MHTFILLFAGLTGPAYLGTYDSYESCNSAIRAIYTVRATPKGTVLSKQQIDIINKTVTTQLELQREYVCVAK
jgi:hypothetical protein